MAKSPNEMIDAVVKNLPAKTGKTADEWVEVLRKDGPEGHRQQIDWLKKQHGLGHVQASIVTTWLEHGGNPYADTEKLVDDLFSGRNAVLRPLYDALAKEMAALGSDVKAKPAVTNVPFYRHRKFAEVRPAGGALEIGLAVADKPAEKAPRPGGPDRINVKRTITEVNEIAGLREELKKAYEMN